MASDSKPARKNSYTGAEGAGSRTRVRQSALYTEPRRRSALRHVERPGDSELDGDSSAAAPSDHPVTGTRVRQSVLYSNRPRRPRRRRVPASTEEHLSEVSSHELGRVATDLPTFEVLSSSDPALLTPQISELTDDDDAPDVEQMPLYSMPTPKGVTRAMIESLGDLFTTVSYEELIRRRPRPHENKEELRREYEEYLDSLPRCSLRESFDRILASQHAYLTEEAVKHGEAPPPDPLLGRETSSLQAPQHPSAAHPEQTTAPRKPRHEASMEEIVQNGNKWMREEVMLCFKKHVERTAHLADLDEYDLDEFRHQCFNQATYYKVFHHYNFTVKMKMRCSNDRTVEMYFAEVKEIFGWKQYFCCPLEPNENGHCYACKSQGMDGLQHPATGGFDAGSAEVPGYGLCCYEDDL